ncbi:hypothetical protein [Couchioplanes caeruleus]|uniref:MYXO-CTERM domain-containing protein n=2 Tax=Couchioplanes caeruleus TaxID=56438 RepID=A0A1K0GUL3_9ACTN|nr:hypothetical protein [Couchioplanes caeruleus]OJF15020.1 hypothetical protein BG844_06790 [Couchioplanes caeruleus subsp. caeruleus]ROP28932.1 MYXO-CTERM domain-containing protein [Couchioplanes caeruleus]
MTATARDDRPSRFSSRLRPALTLLPLGGAVALAALPLLRPDEPFDATLRCTVWLAVVVAATAGAGKPAALFGAVAAVVETCAQVTSGAEGPGSPMPIPAALVALALVATRRRPSARRIIARLTRPAGRRPSATAAERPAPGTVKID